LCAAGVDVVVAVYEVHLLFYPLHMEFWEVVTAATPKEGVALFRCFYTLGWEVGVGGVGGGGGGGLNRMLNCSVSNKKRQKT
jgi:hypothetical protein